MSEMFNAVLGFGLLAYLLAIVVLATVSAFFGWPVTHDHAVGFGVGVGVAVWGMAMMDR